MEKGWIGVYDDEGNEKRRVEMGRKRCRPHRISLDRFPQVQKSKRENGGRVMRKAILDEAVGLAKKVKRMRRYYYATIINNTVSILIEDFIGLFDKYDVEPLEGNEYFDWKVITEYEGIIVQAYAREDEVEKYGIQI